MRQYGFKSRKRALLHVDQKIELFESFEGIKYSILYEAIDFHIYPKIIKNISETFFFNIEEIKNMMWTNSSSNNFRKPPHSYLPEKWSQMHRLVKQLQISYLNSIKVKGIQ